MPLTSMSPGRCPRMCSSACGCRIASLRSRPSIDVPNRLNAGGLASRTVLPSTMTAGSSSASTSARSLRLNGGISGCVADWLSGATPGARETPSPRGRGGRLSSRRGERVRKAVSGFTQLEVDLRAHREHVTVELALVGGIGEIIAECISRAAGHVDMRILRHQADVIRRVPDAAQLIGDLLAAIDVERRGERGRAAVDVGGQVHIVDAAVDLERAPAAIIERMEDLHTAETAALVGTGRTREVETGFDIAAPETGIAVQRCAVRRGVGS